MNKEQGFLLPVPFFGRWTKFYFLLCLLLLIAYFPSFQAEWHFDDLPNILDNPPLHLTELTATALKNTFFAYPEKEGTLLRPVSNFSFALNWFFHQDRVFGYHLVNFLIHFLSTIFLYKSCLLVLSAPRIGNKYHESRHFIAALATLFWALNPIQTQAVTYIVQRMASLATLFTIIGIWCYLKARLLYSTSKKQGVVFHLGMALAFLLALGSKENAVLFPVSVALIELFLFRKQITLTRRDIFSLLTILIIILLLVLVLRGTSFFTSIPESYNDRSFTLTQRVLTQSRIVLFYLSLLFYPAPFRLSLIHDIQLSTSLITPITTLFSIISIVILVILPFVYHRRYPLFAFSILFFFLNHSVESTFLNLELIFEHRNYLPSLFLFLPVAAALGVFIKKYQQDNRTIYILLSAVTGFLILFLILGTFARNKVWQTEQSLWADALAKAPQSAGPYISLGRYYLSENNLQKSFELTSLSLDKYAATPWKSRVWAYGNMGYIMTLTRNYGKALELYNKTLAESKDTPYGKYNTPILADKARVLWCNGQKEQAVQIMEKLVEATRFENGGYLQQHGEMLLALNRVEEALALLQRVLVHSDMQAEEYRKTLLNFALIYARMGFMEKSSFYRHLAESLGVPVVPASLYSIETSLLADKKAEADQAMQTILARITWPELIAILNEQSLTNPSKALNYPLLREYAADWIARQKE